MAEAAPKDSVEAANLVIDVVEFFDARWAGEPDRYSAYCTALQLALRHPDELMRMGWDVRGTVAEYLGGGAPDEITPELHVRCLAASDRVNGGRQRIVSLPTSPAQWEVVVGTIARANPEPPRLTGALARHMESGLVGNIASWWTPERTYLRQMNDLGSVTIAQIATLATFGDGRVRPIGFTFFLREPDRRWIPVGFYSSTPSPSDRDFVRIEF